MKFDGGKVRLELLPVDALYEVGKVYTFGAWKYSSRNWELGMAWSRLFGACLRHLWAWALGQSKDPETGLPHLCHAAFCVLGLLAYELRGVGSDDLPKVLSNDDLGKLLTYSGKAARPIKPGRAVPVLRGNAARRLGRK